MTTKDWLATATTEATLKEIRLKLEEAMALSLHETMHGRAIIEAQAECIAEQDDTIDDLRSRLDALHEQNHRLLQELAKGTSASMNTNYDLVRKMKQHQLDRMENVTRIASAAIRHIDNGNHAIAKAFLEPLAQGVHDAYDDYDLREFRRIFDELPDDDFNMYGDTRPDADSKAAAGAGQVPYLFGDSGYDSPVDERDFANAFADAFIDRALKLKEKDE